MPITIHVLEPPAWPAAAADVLQAELRRHPQAVVGFPTGHTPLPFYAELRRRAATADAAVFQQLRAVMLDEYLGAAGSPVSFNYWLERELFDPLRIAPERRLVLPSPAPDADAATLAAACGGFEGELAAWGGCDLQFLGLGGNGHIGFNDPGSLPDSRTRAVALAPETARANAAYWPRNGSGAGFVPDRALTQGIATILAARRVCLLVRGEGKAAILRQALHGPIGPAVPASFLRRAKHLLILADTAAGAGLA